MLYVHRSSHYKTSHKFKYFKGVLNFDVLLTVHLSIILVIDQFNGQILVL